MGAAAGWDDAMEEPPDAGLDDGVLPGRRGPPAEESAAEGFRKTDLFAQP